MFTNHNGYAPATAKPLHTATLAGRKVYLTDLGLARLADRLADGESQDEAVKAVLYTDFGFDVVGWYRFAAGKRNPWSMCGQVQICRTVKYGKVHYTATSMLTDHTSATLGHLLGRLTRMQFDARRKAKRPDRRSQRSDGETWARRAEEGWGPGGY